MEGQEGMTNKEIKTVLEMIQVISEKSKDKDEVLQAIKRIKESIKD